MNKGTLSYRGHRFQTEIISHAVWLYHRFCLSFRDVEDLLAERGITVSYETIRMVQEVRPRVRPQGKAANRAPGRHVVPG